MALCAEKGPRIVDGYSAIIQAGFADHMDDRETDYPRLEQLITWPPKLKNLYIGGDLCVYPQPYRLTCEFLRSLHVNLQPQKPLFLETTCSNEKKG
jgi:hypothetical protein